MSLKIALSKEQYVEVCKSKFGKPVVILHKKSGEKTRKIFIGTQAWNVLKEASQQISSMLISEKPGNIGLTEQTYAVISNYDGKYYVGIHKMKDGGIIKGSGMNMNVDVWHTLMENAAHIDEMRNNLRMSECTPNCTFEVLMTKVHAILLSNIIREAVKKNCYGCQVDHPSQIQHMDGGCLSDWSEAVDAYTEEAGYAVDNNQVMAEYSKVLQQLPFLGEDSFCAETFAFTAQNVDFVKELKTATRDTFIASLM